MIVPVLVLAVYLTGIKNHRPFYVNVIISGSILSVMFLIFITTGLYNGWQLKDDFGSIIQRIEKWRRPRSPRVDISDVTPNPLDIDEGLTGMITSVLSWIVIGVFGALLFWIIGAIVWVPVVIATGLLYWIVYNCFRMIFQKSSQCKGNMALSIRTSVLYTGFYILWATLILLGVDFLRR